MLYNVDKLKCVDEFGNENGKLLYGVFGYVELSGVKQNVCHLITPDETFAKKIIEPRTLKP